MNEILMYGPIGEDFWEPENSITAKSVMTQLADMTGDVNVRISSGGGDVYAGIDIMNALKNYDRGTVTVIIESLAASAASFIAVGGADRVLMRDSSEMMIHRAWTYFEGNVDEANKTLSDLERQDVKLANIYAGKAGGTVDDWLAAMSSETWYTAQEAVEAGLADEIIPAKPAAKATAPDAKYARRRFKFANRSAAPPPAVKKNSSEKTMDGAGMNILDQLAKEFGKSPEDVKAALSGFFNETVQVRTEIELSYPDETQVVPTGTAQINPVGDVPQGLSFALGEVEEGWSAEVDNVTGVLSVTAPNAEPGASSDFVVTVVSGDGEPVDLTARVSVKSAAEETPAASDPVAEPADDSIRLDRETYAELKAAAQFGWKALQLDKDSKLVEEVDSWIRDGRISAALRNKAISAMRRDASLARDLYGSNPKDTIPTHEIGFGKDDSGSEEAQMDEDRIAEIRRSLNLNN